MSDGIFEQLLKEVRVTNSLLEHMTAKMHEFDGTKFKNPATTSSRVSSPAAAPAKPAAPKAKATRKSSSPLFDDDDAPAPTPKPAEPEASDEVDWVGLATKLARQKVADGVDRAAIKKLISDEGLQSIAQAEGEQAQRLHDAIKALGNDEEDGF